jgi:hypothetical protein
LGRSKMTGNKRFFDGSKESKEEVVKLRAGPLTMFYETGILRDISFGKIKIISQIYISLRDPNWLEVQTQILNQKIESTRDSFHISLDACKEQGNIRFQWKSEIIGSSSGSIQFRMEGIAQSTFQRNRLGFCVLHPAREWRGVAFEIMHPDGMVENSYFPEDISPIQPATNICRLEHEIVPGVRFRTEFEGELFEMEDQRNWSDNDFKTYATPLHIPYPVKVIKGSIINQSINIVLLGGAPISPKAQYCCNETSTLEICERILINRPRIGLGMSSHTTELNILAVRRLKALNLNHLRVDLRLSQNDYESLLKNAWEQAQKIDASLEIGLIFSGKVDKELIDLGRRLLEINPRVSLWLIFQDNERLTPIHLIEAVKPRLKSLYPEVPIGGGARTYFADLNRKRDILSCVDVVSYSLNPQVHVNDDLSLLESLPAQGEMVRNAHKWNNAKPVAVTPITLKPQFNPITGEMYPTRPGELPSNVDSRQSSLLAACWTLGSLKYLSENGAISATYFETTGWAGIMETGTGSPLPSKFASFTDSVFPIYHILADLGEYPNGAIRQVISTQPDRIIGFAIQTDDCLRLMIANLCSSESEAIVNGLGNVKSLRVLDQTNVEIAMQHPEKWRSQSTGFEAGKKTMTILMNPYAVATLDYSLMNENQPDNIETP